MDNTLIKSNWLSLESHSERSCLVSNEYFTVKELTEKHFPLKL